MTDASVDAPSATIEATVLEAAEVEDAFAAQETQAFVNGDGTNKPRGFLTRDSRVVERKKYGRAKARRSFQFSKR